MLSLRRKHSEQTHEEAFLDRYQQLYGWLLQVTDGDRELAKDLVQDAFVHFTFVRPDLRNIRNLDGYLFTLARNLHISQVRRATNSRLQQLSILDYDSSELGLRIIDLREQIQVQDELRRICHYACVRKESAWAGSVLILRFFYGYYATEIARILRNARSSVDVLLKCARHEARLYLSDPQQLSFMSGSSVTPHAAANFARDRTDFLGELRQMIFTYREGDCPTLKHLKNLYQPSSSEPLNAGELAHIVSCQTCLDGVNKILGLPTLSERHPVASIGREPRAKKGGDDSDDRGFGGGSAAGQDLKSIKRHADETFDHKPSELFVAVNGYTLGSQKISSKQNELTLDVNVSEPITFVEVFSEQQIRLLFACVEDPPAGPIKQPVSVALSDGRRLEATVKFRSPWPTLHIVYSDPGFTEVEEAFIATYQRNPDAPLPVVIGSTSKIPGVAEIPRRMAAVARSLFAPQFWLRPSIITVIFAALLAGVLLWLKQASPAEPLTAADLLARSTAADEAMSARSDLVLHRTINLEESVPAAVATGSTPQLLNRRKIEIWQSGERGLIARRLYDERGKLLGGVWTRKDGVQTLYHHGAQPRLQLKKERPGVTGLGVDHLWQIPLAAEDFAKLIHDSSQAQVEERRDSYVISYLQSGTTALPSGLIKATLTIGRSDLHAIEQTLTVRVGNETRQYHFLETSFERRVPSTVAPAVFEPEPELSGTDPDTRGSGSAGITSASPHVPISASSVTASSALEVEVLRLLNQAGADLGEQISVTRAPEGFLRVQGITETEKRKKEILSTLGPISSDPAVRLHIQTIEEALKSQRQQQTAAGMVSLQTETATANTLPVDAELRHYFRNRGVSEREVDEEIRQFSRRTLGQSLQILKHAGALKALAQRFSEEELRTLDAEAKTKWQALIKQHAQAIVQGNASLRREIAPLFPSIAPEVAAEGTVIQSDSDLVRAAERLFEFCSANDRVIRAAFSISPEVSRASAIRGPEFWGSLRSAEKIAETFGVR